MQNELVDLSDVKVFLFEYKEIRDTVQKLYVQFFLQHRPYQGSSNGGISCRLNLRDHSLWIYSGLGKEGWGSVDDDPEKLSEENVLFDHRDLPFIDAVNYIIIYSELYTFQIQDFIIIINYGWVVSDPPWQPSLVSSICPYLLPSPMPHTLHHTLLLCLQ